MKILVVNGHPRSDSFCGALADAYVAGAREAGHEVDVLLLSEMKLEPFIKLKHSSINPVAYPAEMTAIHDKMLWKEDRAGLVVTVALAVAVALQSRLSSTWANTTTVDPDSAPSPEGSWERAKAVAERDCRVTRLDDAVM
jgi:hypothetical protein